MLKKFKLLFVIASLSITLSLMSNTYSRYVASSNGNVEIEFAKWQILVDNNDITTNANSNITLEPVIEKNENVADNKIAPASVGYFDIEIDPTNVDVSFLYNIDLDIANNDISDLLITKYAIVPENYLEGDALEYQYLTENKISGSNIYTDGGFKKFTVRVFFQWYEGDGETMNNEQDTQAGIDAANNSTKFTINANINFEQII